ncbi:bifunctional hydroxymethylpyrimidine kinase/phosphomethylpyrimidine kinase [Halomicrobium salinisoli]|uniref:bifunctional hydroxymethylpyrimidine kinase/phosphomethylpyrimidine kinase n=1 Tax=Halomicrobium salinisoli TaxID=2878391 RepID=UPI001CF0609B|nr:bifunctional hydroxymethylpyrimidine kinase/phosphomethylpyrimidine kinase [Halomicrobium salinisoli]
MTRQPAPVRPPVVLTIAGSDAGGGAGIQADLKTIEACGAFGTSAITSATAQNTRGVESTHLLPRGEIEAQIGAVRGDFDVAAVKTGMLATTEVVDLVAERAPDLPNLVVDPVMVAASGDRLLEPAAEAAYEDLIAEARLVTPNADEAEVLTGVAVTDPETAREAGERLVEMGAEAALVKGGHVPGDDVVDTLVGDDAVRTFRHDRVDTDATHGSGCTLSSAVAARLARGDGLETAVSAGIDLLSRAVRYNLDVGEGPGAVHHAVGVRDDAARGATAEAVRSVATALAGVDAEALTPSNGATAVGATPYAESLADVAAVGVDPEEKADADRGVRFGAADGPAERLLAAREAAPSLRFAVDCRRSEALRSALEGPVATVAERTGEVDEADGTGGATGVRRAVDRVDGSPLAVEAPDADRLTLVSSDADRLAHRVETLSAELAA